jgi:23S rRNA (cytosine1962-C5)-methyltransferase
LVLAAGREKSLKRRHPWVFASGIARVEGAPAAGDTVALHAASGEFLAMAAYSPQSQIRARVWCWEERDITAAFFADRIHAAATARQTLLASGATNAVRLVHGESDGLPGVIADRYADTVAVQLNSAGAEHWRDAIADALCALDGVTRVYERSDDDARKREGLSPASGLLRGAGLDEPVLISENGLQFHCAVAAGQKTGYYLDQRNNRLFLKSFSSGRTVLDAFCHSGGFALHARAGGAAAVTAIDSSAPALAAARDNERLNKLAGIEWIEADVFTQLRKFRDQGRRFDIIVLDPPKLAPTAAHAEKAARAYKDINLLGFKMLNPGGMLMTYSCSGGISAELFQKIIAGAALDAGVNARIVAWHHAAADHPVALSFPEGEYLKGLVCFVAGQ